MRTVGGSLRGLFSLNLLLLFLLLLPSACVQSSPEREASFSGRREREIVQLLPPKPTRIVLKRTSKGKYSWELRGEDPDEMIEVDRKLRQYLSGEGAGPEGGH